MTFTYLDTMRRWMLRGNDYIFLIPAGVLFLLFFSFPAKAFSVEIVPFYTYNQSPLIQIHGLPPLDDADLADAGRFRALVSVDVANNYVVESDATENLTLDGESYRSTLALRYGIANGVECGIDIPYVAYGGGVLDGFIEDFHSFFGLPNGGREQAPRNRLLYQYSVNGIDRLNLRDSRSGIGDIRLSGALQLFKNSEAAVALRASLKLPTGESARLLGSGSTDFAVWFSAKEDYKLPALGYVSGFGGVGGMYMSDGDVLSKQQRAFAGFGSLGFGWSPLQWLALKVQANGHTSLYKDSGLKAVDGTSVQLVSGGTIGFGCSTSLDLGVSEDVVVETSPDVVFTVTLRTAF